MAVTTCFLCSNNNGSGGLGVDILGGGSPSLYPAQVYSSSIAPQYEKQNNKTYIYHHGRHRLLSAVAFIYKSPAINVCRVEIIYFICMVKDEKKNASLLFHFPHKSGIPLPVKVGRLSAGSGVPGDRKRETEVPLGKPFNAAIYTAGRAGS